MLDYWRSNGRQIEGHCSRDLRTEKKGTCYTTLTDLDNGEKIKLITKGVPAVEKMQVVTFEGKLTPGAYGFYADGVMKKSSLEFDTKGDK